MNSWNITIRGTGPHHNNGNPVDANRMAADFVAELHAAGHEIVSASVTYGSDDDIMDANRYLDDRDATEGGTILSADMCHVECLANERFDPKIGARGGHVRAVLGTCRLMRGHAGEHRSYGTRCNPRKEG